MPDTSFCSISKVEQYVNKRSTIKSGDLLAWSDNTNSRLTNIVLSAIRFFTMSEFSHVGVAWWDMDRLYVLEASIPRIRLIPVSDKETFYLIPMGVQWHTEYYRLIHEHLGKPYSILDAIRGYFGNTDISNDRWQCAELANKIYQNMGIELGRAYTPSKLVTSALLNRSTAISLITRE